ncbi:MAG: glycosyltransferase family 2 protein [Salinivenus sp.]
MTDVAVVIPLYNGARWIGRTLASVQAQTHPPTEVIVVDDGSDDRSRALVQERPGVTLLRNPTQGANAARRVGYEHTTAPLVAFLDQDDVWAPTHLEELVAALRAHPTAAAAVAPTQWFRDDEGPTFSSSTREVRLLDPWKRFPVGTIPTPSAVLIRRTALDAIGGWPTQFVGTADYYVWLRLSARQPLVQTKCVTVGYRQHDSSHSARLRAETTGRYLAALRAAATAALAHRPTVEPGFKERLDLLSHLERLVESIVAKPTSLSSAANALEDALSTAPATLRRSVAQQVLWFLGPAVRANAPVRGRTLAALYDDWPAAAPTMGHELRAEAEKSWPWWVFVPLTVGRIGRGAGWVQAARVLRSRLRHWG